MAPRTARKKAEPKKAADLWKEEIERAGNLPAKTYTLDGHYEEGEKVDHSSFGLGMVKKLISPDKMEVLFEEELKVMIRAVNITNVQPAPARMPRRLSWARRPASRPEKSPKEIRSAEPETA
ncbi:MAG: hypothetical protein CVU64_00680 [Deltaproteobacteria bacterium HGW-Deltaproteobacteria-21]|jgi:hypothetical protein|nr:MAG: hypothetical protein CVU64_00680 [Deltaproteobacteria bacterium HGW-Deltaproteobacteria-21]PKN61475.1 MAG: hypothetical protein CVU57_29375 [Deltaproteobacteria bacterium HGW-Deltaproteobacteria-15]